MRNRIDADDAVGNGQVFNGTAGNDRFVGRSAERTQDDLGSAFVGEEFTGSGGRDVFLGRGGNDSFALDGQDRVVAAAEDGFQGTVFGFNDGNNTINFRNFDAASIDDVIIEEGNGGTLVSVEGSQAYNLVGVDVDDINANDFIFSRNNNTDNDEVVAAPEDEENAGDDNRDNNNNGNLNTDIASFNGNSVLVGTDGDDLIDANEFIFTPARNDADQVQSISAGTGADTIITPTNANFTTVVDLGLADTFGPDDGDADTVRVNSTGNRVEIFDFNAGDDGNDRIDLSDTGITDFNQLDISGISGGNDTLIEGDNLQDIVLRGDSDGVGIPGQADDLNDDDFIFADDDIAVG